MMPRKGATIPAGFTPADWVAQANIDLMNHPQWCTLSCVLACGTLVVTPEVPTAATDGWNVKINPEFARKLTRPELRFVLAHEALHKAYMHLHVWRKCWDLDAMTTNVAADHYVNLAIVDADVGEAFVTMPSIGVQPDEAYRGMSVGQIFERLQQGQQKQKQKQKQDDGGDGAPGFDSHDWEGAQSGDAVAQSAQREAIEAAIRQGEIVKQQLEKRKGNGSGRSATSFGLLTPRVDWREQLREFMRDAVRTQDESSWRRPNRRFLVDDTYMPSLDGRAPGEIVVGIDTSGSCFGGPEMNRFVTELQSIVGTVRPRCTHVVYWDSEVTGHQTFTDGSFDVAHVKPTGGGGTTASVLFDYLRVKRIQPAAIVNFTDGYVGDTWGRADCPVLWAISTINITAPFGRTITIDL